MYTIEDGENLTEETLAEYFQGMKIKNISAIAISETEAGFVLISEDGQIYKASTGENLSHSLYNAFFTDKNIKMTGSIALKIENCNFFITEEGKAYVVDIKTNEIKCINDMLEELKDKKVENIFHPMISSNQFEQKYIAIILEDGTAYYTEDFKELNNFSTETLPELTPIVS